MNISLPKWPALIVTGKPVTQKQAAEILIRTDRHLPDFEYGCNAHEVCEQLSSLFNIPKRADKSFSAHWEALDNLRKRMNKIELEYLSNSQIVSSFIGGPHGWCNWTGNIFTNSYNIGKWPSVEAVHDEWNRIAGAFPYLKLTSWLMSGEQCEENLRPLVKFRVEDGATIITACEENEDLPVYPVDNVDIGSMLLPANIREVGIPVDELKAKLIELYGDIPQYELT